MGDGLLLEFQNALDAVECGVELQRVIHVRNARKEVLPLRIRIGIHLGDVQHEGTDILGDAVNVASRLEPIAEPEGLCVSFPVYDQVRNKLPYTFENLGPKRLKGVQEPVGIYRVVFPWTGAAFTSRESVLPRLAVLPLTNISPDPKDEYFAEGLTEELITVLSQVKGLRVISRTSVSGYKGTTKPATKIGTELQADSVLIGSVRKVGNQLRIAVQLIDTRSDEQRWSQTYDRKLENIFGIQTEIAERTAAALRIELLHSDREAIQSRPTSSLSAYEAYLRGIQAIQRFHLLSSDEVDREVVQHFEEAIRHDPSFSAAYARLAIHLIEAIGETRPAAEVALRAQDLVTKALETNPNSSDGHLARAMLVWQLDLAWDRVEAELLQAITLNPSSCAARVRYGALLQVLQRWDEAQVQLRAAREQDPLGLEPRGLLAQVYVARGDLPTAISVVEVLLQDFPNMAGIRAWLAALYAWAGRREDAARMIEPFAGAPDLGSRIYRATVQLRLGREEDARALLADWEAGKISGAHIARYAAELYAMLGDKTRALALLEQDERSGERLIWQIYQARGLDSIRDDARFIALLRAENLPTTVDRPRAS